MKFYLKRIESKISDMQYIIIVSTLAVLFNVLIQLFINFIFKNNFTFNYQKTIVDTIILCIFGPILDSALIILFIHILRDVINIHKKIYLLTITIVVSSIISNFNGYLVNIFCILPMYFFIVYTYLFYKPKKFSRVKVMILVNIFINSVITILNFL